MYVEDHDVSHVVDSHHGIYSAQFFCQRFGDDLTASTALLKTCLPDVLAGPGGDHYDEAWQEIMDNAVVMLADEPFMIYESEGIYLVRDGLEWCDKCDWWLSADCDCPHVTTKG